jgi:hypothetical protein
MIDERFGAASKVEDYYDRRKVRFQFGCLAKPLSTQQWFLTVFVLEYCIL